MKVVVTLEIEIDPEAWDTSYGTGTRPSDVRPDVKWYVQNTVRDQIADACDQNVRVTVR